MKGDRVELRRDTVIRFSHDPPRDVPTKAGHRGTIVGYNEDLFGFEVLFDDIGLVLCTRNELRKLNLLEVIAEASA